MKRFVTLFTLFAGLLTVAEAKSERPNILFVFTDDHAPHAIGAYNGWLKSINPTPVIDKLAREGMLFEKSFCSNSICGPSRAVILSGKHSHKNGFMNNGNTFDWNQQTFPKLLQKAGYQTAIVGKWHLGSTPQGYDYYDVLKGQGPYYNPPMITADDKGNPVTKPHTGYTTDIITDKALAWLKNDRDEKKPFMLMYQHKAPHRNWQPGPAHLTTFDDVEIPEPETLWDDYKGRTSAAAKQAMTIARHLSENDLKLNRGPNNLTPEQRKLWEAAYGPKNEAFRKANLQGEALVKWKYQRYIKDYLRCVQSVDDNLGRVLDYLDKSGLAKNTIVIYSSDQGWYLGDHGWYDKRWMYEESLVMPLLVRWPGVVKPGSRNSDIVSNLDFAQTFLDIAGVKSPADMQGASLVPLLKAHSPKGWRTHFYYHYYEFPGAHSVARHYGVTNGRHKLIYFYQNNEWELFDLKKDPNELQSVYGNSDYKTIQSDLLAELKRLRVHYKVPAEDPVRPPRKRPNQPNRPKKK